MPLVESLDIKLTPAKARNVAMMVKEGVDSVRHGRTEMDTKIASWWERFEVTSPRRTLAFKQASNLRVNLTQWIIDSVVDRSMRTVHGQDPAIRVVDESLAAGLERAKPEAMLDHLFKTDLAFAQNSEQAYINAFIEGTGIGKLVGRNDYRSVRDREGEDLVERTISERPGLGLEIIDTKDFWVANAAISDINRQSWVAHRVWLRWDDIKRRVDQGIYKLTKAQLAKIKNLKKSRRSGELGSEQIKADLDKADESGWDAGDEYEIVECEWRYDCDNDGLEEECLFTVLVDFVDFPLRAEKLPFWNGYRNYLIWRPLPRANRFYGRSLAGMIQMLQDEGDAVLNQSLDASTLAILAGLTPILSRGMKTVWEKHKWDLGKAIYVDVPEQFNTLKGKMGHELQLSEVQLDRIFSLAERAAGVNDTTLGKVSEGDKTLGEVQLVAQEGNVKFSRMAEKLQLGNKELGYQTIEHAYQLYMTDPVFRQRMDRVCGGSPFEMLDGQTVSLREIRQRFDVQPTGNTSNSNQQTHAAKWMAVFSQYRDDIFVAQNLERGWYLRNQQLQALGLRQEAEQIIGTQEDAQKMQQAKEEQEEAAKAIAAAKAGFMLGEALDPTKTPPQEQNGQPPQNGQKKPPVNSAA